MPTSSVFQKEGTDKLLIKNTVDLEEAHLFFSSPSSYAFHFPMNILSPEGVNSGARLDMTTPDLLQSNGSNVTVESFSKTNINPKTPKLLLLESETHSCDEILWKYNTLD